MNVKTEREVTTNYGLVKPKQIDFYNVDDFNSNMDKIDGQLKISTDQIKNLYAEITALIQAGYNANARVWTGSNLNDIPIGIYTTNATGVPVAGVHFIVDTKYNDTGKIKQQIAMSQANGTLYFRWLNTTTWSKWTQLVTTDAETGALKLTMNGHIIGWFSGTSADVESKNQVARDNANIMFHDLGGENWSGIVCDSGGQLHIKAGTLGTPRVKLTHDGTYLKGGAWLNNVPITTMVTNVTQIGLTDAGLSTTDILDNLYKIIYAAPNYSDVRLYLASGNLHQCIISKLAADGITVSGDYILNIQIGNNTNLPNKVTVWDNQKFREIVFFYDRVSETGAMSKAAIIYDNGSTMVYKPSKTAVLATIANNLAAGTTNRVFLGKFMPKKNGTVTIYVKASTTTGGSNYLALFSPYTASSIGAAKVETSWHSGDQIDYDSMAQGAVDISSGNGYLRVAGYYHSEDNANANRYYHLQVCAGVPIYFVSYYLGNVTVKIHGTEGTL